MAKAKTKEYAAYLRIINARPAMTPYTPVERLEDFRKAFGKAPEEFEDEYRRYMQKFVLMKLR